MAGTLERTCWRGMQTEHPPEWELAVVSGLDEPGRCTFADRYYQRLDIRWSPLKYVPNLKLVLDKHRRRSESEKDRPVCDMDSPPPDWEGVMRQAEPGVVVHAARFFRHLRWLVEATLVWPGRRDLSLERQILESISAQDPDAPLRLWQAMGITMRISIAVKLICIGCVRTVI